MRTVVATGLAAGLLLSRSAGAAPEPIGRLGHDVVPVSQAIVLDLDPRKPDYTGSIEVVLNVRRQVSSFSLHAEAIDVRKATIAPANTTIDPMPLTVTASRDGQIEAKAPQPLAPGRYTLVMEFHNDFDTQAKGLYRLQTGGAWYAFTQFEAVDAREAFPCWDEPSFKIPYQFTLTVPTGQMALANTPEERTVESGDRKTTVFKPSRPLPSYLLAVAVGPFEATPVPGTSIPTRIIGVAGSSAFAGNAIAATPPILAALERYFGSRYPYEKLDLIAVPEYWYGAMENPGLITFLDRSLLLDAATANSHVRKRLAVYLAHEIAHMWFGDLVTMAWWDDLWLNESFATWMEQKILIELFPEYNEAVDQVRSAQGVMGLDALLTTRAMRQPIQSVDSLLQSADALAYAKGAAVLNMVESWLGPEAFRAGVLEYLKAHTDGNATANDLWSALSKASKQDVKGMLSSFLDQAGVPLVSAELLPGNKVKLSQTRFLAAGVKPPKPQAWRIPVALRYPVGESTRVQRVMLGATDQVAVLESRQTPAWVYPNADAAGYYRWSVPAPMLDKLAANASRALNVRERVGFLGEVQALLAAGRLPGDAALKTLSAFASDDDPEVVSGVVDGLAKIRETFFAERDDAAFAPFVQRTLAPALARIGPLPLAGEPPAVTRLRPNLYDMLADAGRDEDVLATLEGLGRKYLADRSSVDPSMINVAVSSLAIRGDAALFDTYQQRFETSKIPEERRLFLSSLGNFRNPALVDRALAYVFVGPMRPQELFTIPQTMGQVPSSRAKLWAWAVARYDEIAARIPADYMVFMPYFAGGCSTQRLDAAKAFFAEPRHAPPGTAVELARVSEAVNDCVALDRREGAAVRKYTAMPRSGGTGAAP